MARKKAAESRAATAPDGTQGTQQREPSNAGALLSTNESILKQVFELYTEQNGLLVTANKLDKPLLPPRKKVNILVVGNHSSGKSSFINWYIGEHILKTGVAIETQGFNFVSSGKKRETLKGDATLELYKRFEGLRQFKGVVECLTTEISTSKQNAFPMLTLIDTPGLVDGNMAYPFDVDATIKWLAERVDLVFVFLDPMGQALCSRTMNLVSHMNRTLPDKVRFYVTKIDQVEKEEDRQKVLIQITQNLSAHIQHKAALTLPTICIPRDDDKPMRANAIYDMCQDIEKVIDATVQDTIRTLETDSQDLIKLIDAQLVENKERKRKNLRSCFNGLSFHFLLALHLLITTTFFMAEAGIVKSLESRLPENAVGHYIGLFLSVITAISDFVPGEWGWYIFGISVVVGIVLFVAAKMSWRPKPTLSSADIKFFQQKRAFLEEHVLAICKDLYKKYFAQSIASSDL